MTVLWCEVIHIMSLDMPILSQEFQVASGYGANGRVSQGEWAIAARTGKGSHSKLWCDKSGKGSHTCTNYLPFKVIVNRDLMHIELIVDYISMPDWLYPKYDTSWGLVSLYSLVTFWRKRIFATTSSNFTAIDLDTPPPRAPPIINSLTFMTIITNKVLKTSLCHINLHRDRHIQNDLPVPPGLSEVNDW